MRERGEERRCRSVYLRERDIHGDRNTVLQGGCQRDLS